MTADRLESRHATKELARSSKKPTKRDVKGVKRLARLYKKYKRVVNVFYWQGERAGDPPIRVLKGTVDSNHANCPVSRKSTSGGVLRRRGHTWEGWALTKEIVAFGSGESELLSVLKGAAMLLGAGAMMAYLNLVLELIIETDSSGAIGTASKSGLQKKD